MLIILIGLTGLFTGLDYLMNASSLSSFNIKVLYAFSKWQEALNLLYPLAIILGAIWTKMAFIKQNKLASFYALGITRKDFFKPFFVVSMFVYILFVGLNFSSFATANDTAYMIKKNQYAMSKTEDLFFKYNDSFVYIGTLLPEQKKIEKLTVFKMKNNKVFESLTAKEASFNVNEWIASNIIKKSKIIRDNKEYLKVEHLDFLHTLKGYEPKILKSIYDGQELTLYESIMANTLLENQDLSTEALRADIYSKIVTPLFSIALIMILIFRFPFYARYMNMASSTTQALGGTLFVWGILFALQGIGANGTINPELAIILPIVLLWIYAIYTLVKSDR
ncbi:Permease YjgP/YjgQ [hydrothermal vent metagenome]|uniref:Permease YjgP/YjgQ n=1 Tax=hydrothermal vent metagenome TaxID=652676 RepID=A0A1W1CT87_9ZZZZ